MATTPKLSVYIAGSDNKKAQDLKKYLESKNKQIRITSTWHNAKIDIKDQQLTDDDKSKIAMRNDGQISGSEFLVLIADDERVPGGKFVEAGIALGMGKAVVALGRRENVLMFHENVVLCETQERLYAELTA